MNGERRIPRPARASLPAAAHLVLRRQNRLLLLQRYNTGYEDEKWSLPAGHIEHGESASAALRRESREELGIVIEPEQLQFLLVMHKRDPVDGQERVDFFFECIGWSGLAMNREPNKAHQVQWVLTDEISELCLVDYVRAALHMIDEGVAYGEFGWRYHGKGTH
jgi:8-oxo-dGTP pyrophosphatase MutT (NUDIX family)